VLVSELNQANNPMHLFVVQTPGGPVTIPSPDPGRALTTGNFAGFPVQGGEFSNFKIPILRGVKHTAPYFHDSSAKSLEAVIEHYALFFLVATDCNIDGDPPLVFTNQDKADLLAFLKLL
jgi:cytochrome c peroxidase